MKKKIYICPICRKKVSSNRKINQFYPFCSQQCRLVDLGNWLDGRYAVDGKTGKLIELDSNISEGHTVESDK